MKSFEDRLNRLEELNEKIKEGELPLEEATTLFEEGMKLAEMCSEKLNAAEARLQKLVKGEDSRFQVEPMQ